MGYSHIMGRKVQRNIPIKANINKTDLLIKDFDKGWKLLVITALILKVVTTGYIF